jgi:hypothetical protein
VDDVPAVLEVEAVFDVLELVAVNVDDDDVDPVVLVLDAVLVCVEVPEVDDALGVAEVLDETSVVVAAVVVVTPGKAYWGIGDNFKIRFTYILRLRDVFSMTGTHLPLESYPQLYDNTF